MKGDRFLQFHWEHILYVFTLTTSLVSHGAGASITCYCARTCAATIRMWYVFWKWGEQVWKIKKNNNHTTTQNICTNNAFIACLLVSLVMFCLVNCLAFGRPRTQKTLLTPQRSWGKQNEQENGSANRLTQILRRRKKNDSSRARIYLT